MPHKTIQVETAAQAYLALLGERGVDYFFANAGTDFAPLIDAFARFAEAGIKAPRPVTVPHENVAMAMAHGYYLMTGKPSVVMVHVTVGTGNAVNGIINASRDHIPIILTAGRTPITEDGMPGSRDIFIHWAQESFDQAAMVREYVKWDYELRNFRQMEGVVDRALEMAMSEPRGPVYLTLPREVLAEAHKGLTIESPPRRHWGASSFPDPESIQAAADILATARNPLIITTSVGRSPGNVEKLVALSDGSAIPVVAFNSRYMCFPTNHPMHLGFTPAPFLQQADAILVIDSDVPWYPDVHQPSEECRVIHMGVDPLYAGYPIRSFPCDLALRVDPAAGMPLLTQALSGRRASAGEGIPERYERVKAIHDQQRIVWQDALEAVRGESPIDPRWVSHCIDAVKDDNTIIFNEYDLDLTQVTFDRPGTFFGISAAGGLGWGMGASLGAKLAAPERLVIAAVGDGSYMFGNPTPAHFVSQALGIPTLTVIFNNSCWNAVRMSNLRMYPDGWAAKTKNFPLSQLAPPPRYELLATASGGYGERVDHASEVKPALERAIRAVREEGRQAVLNMILKPPQD